MQLNTKDSLHFFLKRNIYTISFDFEEIVPIIGHYDIEEFVVYTTYNMYVDDT